VVDYGEIPHLWFHKVQHDARDSTGNFYFEGDTIYSYGSHFPIAKHVSNGKRNAVLFTTEPYSVTTSGHISATRYAIPSDVQVFNVPEVELGISKAEHKHQHSQNLQSYAKRIEAEILIAARARSSWRKESAYKSAVDFRAEALAYARFFGLPAPKIAPIPKLDSKGLAAIKAKESRKAAEKSEQTKRERAEALARQAERIERWRAGEDAGGFFYDVPTMLRIEGAEVVTSRGVRVPVSHARRALALVRSVRESGQEYRRNGQTFHVGHYAIDRITPDGTLHAGCHVISWAEIERIAPALESVSEANSTPEVLQ
jgi:hypothetical protein